MADPVAPTAADEVQDTGEADSHDVAAPADGPPSGPGTAAPDQAPQSDSWPSAPADGDETSGTHETDSGGGEKGDGEKGGDGDGNDGDDDDGDHEDDTDEPATAGGGPRKVQIDSRVLVAGVVGIVVVALAVGAYMLGQRQVGGAVGTAGGTKTTATTAFKVPTDFKTFVDATTGVKLSFPKDWEQRSTADLPEKALRLVAGIPNTGDSVSLRVTPYNSEVTSQNVGDQKNLFDALFAGENVKVYENKVLTVRGLPALFYVYSFTDEATGQVGIHAHFFVFQGRKMVSVILQALPEARYATLAPVFDTIVNSLEVAPGPPPDYGQSVAPVTTVAPGSAASTTAPTTAAPAPSTSKP